MKNYLLVVLGKLESDSLCRELAMSLTPIVDSPHLKFNHTKGSLIFHFASEVDQPDLSEYISTIFSDVSHAIILTEINDKVSVYLPEELKNHLFDLETDDGDIEMKMTYDEDISEDDVDENFVALLLSDLKKRIPKPSLDYILEKIKSKGYESLSQFEKDTLDEYSK
jgi:hypothetical protein